jgi:hypothetical protein
MSRISRVPYLLRVDSFMGVLLQLSGDGLNTCNDSVSKGSGFMGEAVAGIGSPLAPIARAGGWGEPWRQLSRIF